MTVSPPGWVFLFLTTVLVPFVAIPVRYLRDRPEQAEVDSFASRWLPTIVFGALGDAFLTVGLGLWFGWIPT